MRFSRNNCVIKKDITAAKNIHVLYLNDQEIKGVLMIPHSINNFTLRLFWFWAIKTKSNIIKDIINSAQNIIP